MQVFKHTIWIARPRDAIFDYFVNFEEAPRWRSFVRTMRLVGPGPVRAGSRVHVVMDLNGDDYEFDLEVLTVERPALWRHRTNEVDYHGAIEYRFEPEQQGTRVTMECHVKPVGWYGWLGLPLLWLRRGQSYRDQLPQLKRAMEDLPAA